MPGTVFRRPDLPRTRETGDRSVIRLGFGAMRLAGEAIWALEENVAAAEIRLTARDMKELDALGD